MKHALLFFVIAILASGSVMAQDKVDYSGKWKLDVSRSKLDQMARIESMNMDVDQTADSLTVTTETKRSAPPNGGMRGRGGMAGDAKFTYSLDGKETKTEQTTQFGSIPVKLKAKQEKGKLKLTATRSMSSPMGEMSMTTKEEWSLSEDGSTLTVKRDLETPRGTSSMTLVFTKES